MLDRLGKELESDLDQEKLGGLGEILPQTIIQKLKKNINIRYDKANIQLVV
jgi:hypothetical protein